MTGSFKRYFLRKKHAKKLLDKFSEKVQVDRENLFEELSQVEIVEAEIADIYLLGGKPLLANLAGVVIPTLFFLKAPDLLPKLIVDKGAIPYVCNGADIMAPGIVKIVKSFKKNDIVLVLEETHNKPIAVSIALCNSENICRRGKVCRNIHYAGDKLFKLLKQVSSV